MENEKKTQNDQIQTEEIDCENDQYIVSLDNEEDLEQKGYRISPLVEDIEINENKLNQENNLDLNNDKIISNNELIVPSLSKQHSEGQINLINFMRNSTNIPSNKNLLNSKSLITPLENDNPKLSSFERESIRSSYNTHNIKENLKNKLELNQNKNLMKEMTLYSSTEIEELKEKVNQKISALGNSHLFCVNNVNVILKIVKELTEILYRKIANTLDQNKYFLKYFKEIIEGYKRFCVDLEKANLNITNINEENQLLSDNITKLIVTTQDTIKTNFEAFSKTLNNNIVANGPFQKINNILTRFEQIKKKVFNDLQNLDNKKDKMVRKFNGNLVPIFTNFKKFENKLEIGESTILKDLTNLFDRNDFFLIEIEITMRINKLFNKLSNFLNTFKISIEELKKCVIEYASLVKDTVEKFISENKKIYGGNMNLDFEQMQKFYESITKESLERSFIVSRVLGSDNTINKFNEYFNEYRNDLIKFRIVNNDIIFQQEKFNISNFQSIEDLISFVVILIPVENKLSSSLLIGKYTLKRDPGIFKSWKNCTILKTLQNSIIIYDDNINKHPVETFNLKKLKFNPKKDKNNTFKFEIIEKKKGVIFDTNKIQNFDAVSEENFKLIKAAFNINE